MGIPVRAIAPQDQQPSEMNPWMFPARYATFGVFHADLESLELYQAGQRVRIQTKVLQGLLLLLSRPGEIVTREEVRQHLWPDAFLTNLDANVNTTMNKLRQVLGDSPDNPTYVETIPRRGYSFVAQVKFSSLPDAPPEANAVVEPASEMEVSAARDLRAHIPVLLRAASLLVAGMILGALLAFVWFFAQAKSQRAASAKVSAALPAHQPLRNAS